MAALDTVNPDQYGFLYSDPNKTLISYDDLRDHIIVDFREGINLAGINDRYGPIERISSLIINEFPLLGDENDPELMKLYSIDVSTLTAMRKTNMDKIRELLDSCGETDASIKSFLENKDGMAFFQESSIVSRRDVAGKGFPVNFDTIRELINSRWVAGREPIHIVIDVSNLTFDKEMTQIDQKVTPDVMSNLTSKDEKVQGPAIEKLVIDVMPRMQIYFNTIKDKYSDGIGDLRHPLNDFQGMFVDRWENHLKDLTEGVFSNLPELFLSFLDGSPLKKGYNQGVDYVNLVYRPETTDAAGNVTKSKIEGRIKHINLVIVNPQNTATGITSLVENGLFFKLRTCGNIVASQIRGMHRYVPLVEDSSLLPAASKPSNAPPLPPKAPPKAPTPPTPPKAKGGSKGGAKMSFDHYHPFFDLYQGQLLKSSVSNQELLTPPFLPTISVPASELFFTKLEMEHIIGVYPAALLFKYKCYAMTIFANLQIMSHESNNGVASTPYIEQKLAFMLNHRDTSDQVSGRSLVPRFKYLLARLLAMEGCLVDDPKEMGARYLPFSSYKPGLEKMIACLTHGKAFHVVEATQFEKMVELQCRTRKFVRQVQTICHDLLLMQQAGEVGVNRDELLKFMIDRLLRISAESQSPLTQQMATNLSAIPTPSPKDPAIQYADYFSKCDELARLKERTFISHCKSISLGIKSLCAILEIDPKNIDTYTLNGMFAEAYAAKVANNIKEAIYNICELICENLTSVYNVKLDGHNPIIVQRAVLFSLLPKDTTDRALDQMGRTFFSNRVSEVLEYPDPGVTPEPTLSLKDVARVPLVSPLLVTRLRGLIPKGRPPPAVGQMGKFSDELQGALYKNIAALVISTEDMDFFLGFFNEERQLFIRSEYAILLQKKREADELKERIRQDPSHSLYVLQHLEETAAAAEEDSFAQYRAEQAEKRARYGEVRGGMKEISYQVDECYIYDEKEQYFNQTNDPDTYDYLCSTWGFSPEEKPMTDGPFMSTSMIIFIAQKVTALMNANTNNALSEIYLNHYGREEIPIIQKLLRMVYDYFTLQGIYVPLVRDERPFYSLEHLLIECLEKKRKYLTFPECNLTTFDNAYANILCIQIFGKPITILINDLSNGKLPVPYGIQNHLCGDPFHPETFYVTFHVLKTILLTLPKCVSLATYLSYLNLLLGESFLHNIYTDASFSLNSRMHDSFFDKIVELQDPIDMSGPGMFLTLSALPDFLEVLDVEVAPETNPGLAQVNPGLAQVNPGLAEVNPDLAQVNPDLAQVNPRLTNQATLYLPVNKPFSDQPGSAAGGTRRYRRYKQKTRRQTLNKRFKKHRTRRLH